MEQLFVTLLNMSLTASWIVGAVVLFRLIFRRAPQWILCLMWGLVAFRLVIPDFIQSPTSLLPTTTPVEMPVVHNQPAVQHTPTEKMDFIPVPEQSQTEQLQSVVRPSVPVVENIEEETPAETPEVFMPKETPRRSVLYWCSIAWVVGLCLMAAYCFLSYLRLYLRVREHIPVEKGVYICDRVNTPFILGLIRPKIYLPVDLSVEDKVYVLAHEFAHIRRKDHWWKPIGFLLLSVYWFNPVMWLAYILLCRDIEGACDEKVIKQLGEEQKKPYLNALINCSAPAKLISACPLAFGEGKLRSRIKAVLHYKKPTLWILIVCIIAAVIITAVFLTDPMKKSEQNESQTAETVYSSIIEDLNKFVSYRLSDDFRESWERGDNFIYSEDFERAVGSDNLKNWWLMLLEMTEDMEDPSCDDFGWILYDLNQDKLEELFFVRNDHSVLAVFTIAEDKPVLLDTFRKQYSTVVTEEGYLHCYQAGENFFRKIQALDENGKFQTVDYCYRTDGKYYDHNGSEVSWGKYKAFKKEHPFEMAAFWMELEITNTKKTHYSLDTQEQTEKASYQVVNNPTPDSQALNLNYPFLTGAGKDYSSINKLIEDAVYKRMYYDLFEGKNFIPEYTKLDYTVTYATDDLISFFYEGTVMVEMAAHPTKLKQGFTFDLKEERRLFVTDYITINDTFGECFLSAWNMQIDDTITDNYVISQNGVLDNLKRCDQDGSETSFYISQDTLRIVYPVPFAVGGYQTVCLRLDSLGTKNDAICHFTASGKLTDKQDIYEVQLYSQKEERDNSKVKVFLTATSNTDTYYKEYFEYDFVSFDEGALYVADFNGDGIDEILMNFVISADGDTETVILQVYKGTLRDFEYMAHEAVFHACDRHPSLVPQGLIMEEDKDHNMVFFYILADMWNYMMESEIQYSGVTVKDLDSDGDYEIICQELTRWGDGLEQIAELTIDYDKECDIFTEERKIIVPAKELPPDYSRYDIEVEIPDHIKEAVEKKAIE